MNPKILLTVSPETHERIKRDAADHGMTVTQWLLSGRGYKPVRKFIHGRDTVGKFLPKPEKPEKKVLTP